MFSLENFYYILYTNLFKPVNTQLYYFSPFGSTDPNNVCAISDDLPKTLTYERNAILFEQEPLLEHQLKKFKGTFHFNLNDDARFFINSEISKLKTQTCEKYKLLDFYYFFHGFAALIWYRDYKYINVNYEFTKHFISLNHLITDDRSYRMLLVSHYIDKNILDKGKVSFHTKNLIDKSWQCELMDPNSKLSNKSKKFISKSLALLTGPLIVDTDTPSGSMSANVGVNECVLHQDAFWHVVSETVFYYPKLHLTEKIFRPIVNRRPFLLVAAPGNLAYLKSYGFKTFDRWIDESYDNETDNDRRLELVIQELEKICTLSLSELKEMQREMNEVLEYNFQHFYGNFRKLITTELIENFKNCLINWNINLANKGHEIDLSVIDFNQVESLLLS